MQDFTFITETDGSSGKVASDRARTAIRAHVMRKHWIDNPDSGKKKLDRTVSGPPQGTGRTQLPISRREATVTQGDDVAASGPAFYASCAHSDNSTIPRHLNRVTDAFVYAGSSIDIRSYGLFHHYSLEFGIVIPDSIHPLPLKSRCASLSAAIQHNSPSLILATCFLGALHESMKHQKDSNGKLETSFSDNRALRYKSATLQGLSNQLIREREGTTSTEADIFCVTILLFGETIIGDRAAIDAHLLGLRRIIRIQGGHEYISPAVATHVHLTTLLAAQLTQTPPILPLRLSLQDRYEHQSTAMPSPSPENQFLLDRGLGSAFLCEPLWLELTLPLQRCLHYMRGVVSRVEYARAHIKVFEGEWIDDVLTLAHVLIAMPYNYSLSQLDERVRLALLLYCLTAIWRFPLYMKWIIILVSNLKSALTSLDESSNGWAYPELRFWMLFVGRQACTLELPGDETAWWNEALNDVANHLSIVTWEGTREIFEQYFYVDHVHATRWEAIWNYALLGNCSAEMGLVPEPEHPCGFRQATLAAAYSPFIKIP